MRTSMASRSSWRAALLLAALPLLALLAACTASSDERSADALQAPPADAHGPSSAAAAPDLGFPTGPAVLVPVGYEPPGDRVVSTGAYVPANGKPTLVYVDAIW